ncbi:hypothetical protein ANN_11513 [Periplaneta americana]|uniref:Uncharacterized protein n=1 Tax=Periplaneta americana TaxID=6978 RepID=A0ABQ8T578_PERAM|nr:hypothetical protein ANN_11513 [Periplaneta americana]
MSPGYSAESYPAFALNGLKKPSEKSHLRNLSNQNFNSDSLVSRSYMLTIYDDCPTGELGGIREFDNDKWGILPQPSPIYTRVDDQAPFADLTSDNVLWGFIKDKVRNHHYNTTAQLRAAVEDAFNEVPLDYLRKTSARTWRRIQLC